MQTRCAGARGRRVAWELARLASADDALDSAVVDASKANASRFVSLELRPSGMVSGTWYDIMDPPNSAPIYCSSVTEPEEQWQQGKIEDSKKVEGDSPVLHMSTLMEHGQGRHLESTPF